MSNGRHMIVLVTSEGGLVHEQPSLVLTTMCQTGDLEGKFNLPLVLVWGDRVFQYDASIAVSPRGITEHRYKEVFFIVLVPEV